MSEKVHWIGRSRSRRGSDWSVQLVWESIYAVADQDSVVRNAFHSPQPSHSTRGYSLSQRWNRLARSTESIPLQRRGESIGHRDVSDRQINVPGRHVDGAAVAVGSCCCCSTRSASSKVRIFTLSGSFSSPTISRPRSMSRSYWNEWDSTKKRHTLSLAIDLTSMRSIIDCRRTHFCSSTGIW